MTKLAKECKTPETSKGTKVVVNSTKPSKVNKEAKAQGKKSKGSRAETVVNMIDDNCEFMLLRVQDENDRQEFPGEMDDEKDGEISQSFQSESEDSEEENEVKINATAGNDLVFEEGKGSSSNNNASLKELSEDEEDMDPAEMKSMLRFAKF